jgi:excinuclease ABC subunit C
MVRFVDGQADKSGYRRFKIKSFEGNDDFRSMQEVVGRRYTRLHEEHRAFPELVIIDGGLGQVGAALAAFKEHDLAPPPLIGLAKREETIVFPDGRELKLPRHDVGLALLMRIRDEAHRFANDFNAEFRSLQAARIAARRDARPRAEAEGRAPGALRQHPETA